jgi:anti-sigma factor RsiW
VTLGCGKSRRLLWSDEHVRLADREFLDARAHVADCRGCQGFLGDMQALTSLIRRLAPRPVTPPSLRERLFNAVAAERMAGQREMRISRRARALAASLIGAVGLVALLLWPLYQSRTHDTWQDAMSAIVEDHARGLHHESLTTSDQRAARQWLTARIAFAVQVPDVNGLVLERAEVCRLNGRRACLLRYRVDGQVVSYYSYELVPDQLLTESAGSTFHEQERAGYRVVAWEEAGVLRALVADLPADRLLNLARACRSRHGQG